MSIITSILHCYGLLISEESVTLMQQYILPLWEKTKPELYEMFSTKSDNDEFFDYLCVYPRFRMPAHFPKTAFAEFAAGGCNTLYFRKNIGLSAKIAIFAGRFRK